MAKFQKGSIFATEFAKRHNVSEFQSQIENGINNESIPYYTHTLEDGTQAYRLTRGNQAVVLYLWKMHNVQFKECGIGNCFCDLLA